MRSYDSPVYFECGGYATRIRMTRLANHVLRHYCATSRDNGGQGFSYFTPGMPRGDVAQASILARIHDRIPQHYYMVAPQRSDSSAPYERKEATCLGTTQ
jgi:hypothetical protein